jgi:hypothetical protein
MATLVANNAEASISRLELRPGLNVLGRAEGNHLVIPHGSVSSRHCEIIWDDGAITVRDLGSTNGTFLDDRPVQQKALTHGQRLRFGNVEYLLEAPELAAPRPAGLRVNVVKHVSTVETAAAPPVVHSAAESIAAIQPVMYEEPSFYRQLPGAFGYPFKSKGVIMLVLGGIVFLALEFLASWSWLIAIISTGYLFSYMQRIVAFTAQGEDEMPDFPEFGEWWSDIILPYLLFMATWLASFAVAIGVFFLFRDGNDDSTIGPAVIAAIVLGAVYFPMALLAVSVSDSFVALSPHIVVPSIFRVFVPYLVTLVFVGLIAGLQIATTIGLDEVKMPVLPAVVGGFVSLYLTSVMMRGLGLLFRCHRERLGWLG